MKNLKLLFILSLSVFIVLASSTVAFGEYPEKTIEVIVPYSAGGGTDRFARTIVPYLEEELGVSVVVVNRPGAAGEVGMTAMAEADRDGYTLGFLSYPDNIIMAEYKEVTYSNEDFHELASFTQTPVVLFAASHAPYDNVDEFVEYANARPHEIVISESGDGHLITAVLLAKEAGIELTTLNYPGAGDNLSALLGGHVDAAALSLLFTETAIDQGCRALALAHPERMEKYPDMPTFKEQGYDVEMFNSRVFTAPKGVSDEVIDTLTEALNAIGEKEELIEDIEKGGEIFRLRTGEEMHSWMEMLNKEIAEVVDEYKDLFER